MIPRKARLLLLAPALLLSPAALAAATWTVCALGCNDTSIQAAYNGAAAGDTIALEGNVQENDDFARGINISIVSSGGPWVWDGVAGSANPTLQFQNGNGATVDISGVTLNNSSAAGGYVLYWNNSGTAITITDAVLERTSTSTNNNAIIYEQAADNHSIDILQSSLVGDGFGYGFYYDSGNNDSVLIENSLLYGFTGSPYAAVYTDRNNTWGGVSIQNDTFFNNNIGYDDAYTGANSGSTTDFTDNLFVGNTVDMSLATGLSGANLAAMEASILHDGFGSQAANPGYGAGDVYAVTAAQSFVNPATSGTPNLHEIAGAPSVCAATDNGLMPSVDKDGNARPAPAGCWDMGAYQLGGTPAASPTPTPSATFTPGSTHTATPTFTRTPSSTPSFTPAPAVSPAAPSPTPQPFTLTPHYPNPNPAGSAGVWLPYTLSGPAEVVIKVFDVSGELVRSWGSDPQFQAAGTYERYWDLRNASGVRTASGVFLVQINAASTAAGVSSQAWEKCAVAR